MSSKGFTLIELKNFLLLLLIFQCCDLVRTLKLSTATTLRNKSSIENKQHTTPLSSFKNAYTKTTYPSTSKPSRSPNIGSTKMNHTDIHLLFIKKQVPNCTCGKSMIDDDNLDVRIIGGTVATPHSYPWQASLHYYKLPICSATIINNRYVLTAAHCIFIIINFQKQLEDKYGSRVAELSDGSVNLSKMIMVLGAHDRTDLTDGAAEIGVEHYLIHPKHKVDQLHDINDVALVRLMQYITYSDNIQPVCLPQKGEIFSGKRGVIVGWGQTRYNGSDSPLLKHGTVYILSDDVCAKTRVSAHFREDPHGMVCAYEYRTDACQGDSGGPLLYKASTGVFIQVGVVSWGIECAKVGYPGVYAEVSSYVEWIYDNTKDAEYCTKP